MNISGGTLGGGFGALPGSEVTISGGTLGVGFNASPSSDVELVGGEFRLNGADFADGTISLAQGDNFTGTLADGSSFIFSRSSDVLNDVTLTAADLPPIDSNPIVVNATAASGPSGLRAGQELTVVAGGVLGNNFAVVDATLNVEAGTLGDTVETSNSVANISGGNVGSGFRALSGSEVNISGGTVGRSFSAFFGSEVNISDGTVGENFDARFGSEVNISGGTFEDQFSASGSVVNISGGSLGDRFSALSDTELNISGGTFGDGFVVLSGQVNLRGSEFSIDGMPVSNLQSGQTVTITERGLTLSGVLSDGEPFSIDLNSDANGVIPPLQDFFSRFATLTVTLEVLGDVNQDGLVNILDIAPFVGVLSSQTFQAEADIDQNGVVNFLDISPFINILAGI